MVIGIDTGFFIELKNENPKARNIWKRVVKGEEELTVSVLSINELLVYFFRNGKSEEGREILTLLKIFPNIKLIPVSERIAELSAGYRYSLGIPTIDSLILTTFIYERCDRVVSTDKHFWKAKEQNIIDIDILSNG